MLDLTPHHEFGDPGGAAGLDLVRDFLSRGDIAQTLVDLPCDVQEHTEAHRLVEFSKDDPVGTDGGVVSAGVVRGKAPDRFDSLLALSRAET